MFGATLPREAQQRLAAALGSMNYEQLQTVAEARDQRDAAFRIAQEASEQNTRLAAENIELCGRLQDAQTKIAELELENEELRSQRNAATIVAATHMIESRAAQWTESS